MSESSTSKTSKPFVFDKKNQKNIEEILKRYPAGRQQSAILPLLDLAQRQCGGWLPQYAMDTVADLLGVAKIRVYEVASFYTMFNLNPVGKNLIQVCRTTPCWLRGSDQLVDHCRRNLGVDLGQTTEDGQFTLVEVECLGACVNAPVVQINDDYYEDLDPERLNVILEHLKNNQSPVVGSQIGRQGSAPEGGPRTLLEHSPQSKSGKTKASKDGALKDKKMEISS